MTAAPCTLNEQYTRLHASVEKGESTDQIWSELSQVCYALGYDAEAVRGAQNIRNPESRRQVEMFLIQKGLLDPASEAHQAGSTAPRSTTREEVADAIGFLLRDHMPLVVMTATLAFPLVLGVGGFLNSGSDAWVFPTLASITVLVVISAVGAMARKVIVESCSGANEPPSMPGLSQLPRMAARFSLDAVVISGSLLLPGILAVHLGLHWLFTGSLLAFGGALTPMSFALRQVHDDWRGLSPRVLALAIYRVRAPYAHVLVACGSLFTPALLALTWPTQSDLYLRASFFGPLIIAPMLLAARLIGRTLFVHRRKLEDLTTIREVHVPCNPGEPPLDRLQSAEPSTPPDRPRTQHGARSRGSQDPRTTSGACEEVRQEVLDRLAQAVEHPTHRDLTALRAQTQAAALEKAHAHQQMLADLAARDQRVADARQREAFGSEAHVDFIPDLTQIPGAQILRGAERTRAGAAAKRP